MMQNNTRLQIQVLKNGKCIVEDNFERFPVIFGRSKDCHLCLKDFSFVSRNHGSIAVNEDIILVTDLNSSNGIRLGKNKELRFSLNDEGTFHVEELTFKLKLVHEEPVTQKIHVERTEIDIVPPRQNLNQEKVGKNSDVTIPLVPNSKPVKELKPATPSAPVSIPSKSSSKLPEVNPQSGNEKHGKNLEHRNKFEWKRINFSLTPDREIRNLGLDDMSLQGALIWEDEIYDVRNFDLGEKIKLGPNQTEPLYIPLFKGELDIGVFSDQGAKLNFSRKYNWYLYREGVEISHEKLISTGHVKGSATAVSLVIALNEVVAINIGFGMQFRLRYVPKPRPLIKKTWIENRDEFKRAITTSLFLHLALSILAVMSAPKNEGPKVKDMPPRFAKLLVEEPKQTFAFQPPPPPPVEEPKPIEEPKPKEEPKAPPKVEKKKEVVKKIEKPKPVVKAAPMPKVPAKVVATPPPTTVVKNNPQPAAEAPKSAEQDLANLFNSMPTPKAGSGGAQKSPTINIQKGSGTPTKSGVRVSGLAAASDSSSSNTTVGLGLGGESGQVGYAQSKNAKAGKAGVAGAVVGAPSFAGVAAEQGITNEEVMKVVNKYLNDVHRCYERALFNDANIVGRVEYEWEISASGNVSSVSIKRSEVSNGDFLNSCVMGVFKKMKFPVAKNGQTTTASIGFPFGKN